MLLEQKMRAPLAKPLLPDAKGFFGEYGGRFVPEILWPNLEQLAAVFKDIRQDADFWQQYIAELQSFSGRPTPVTYADKLSKRVGGAKIYIKREDLNQTGAHKINNVIGQGLVAQRLGKTRVIAETGAGQHGVATATMAARLGLQATIYMGAEDVERQRPNVFWMERLGATVVAVEQGARTLKDAINAALRDWSQNLDATHYVLGTACGPDPFPAMVAYLQSVIGIEAREQMLSFYGNLPSKVYACIGGGSNALGIFQAFLGDAKTELIGAEAGGRGLKEGEHASRIAGEAGTKGVAQGYLTLFLQNDDGQMLDTHSVAAGLDYIGISPVIADLWQQGRVRMERVSDIEVTSAMQMLMDTEGIIPALESAHGLACALREAAELAQEQSILLCLSGRGDKDIFTIAEVFEDESWNEFLRYKVAQLET